MASGCAWNSGCPDHTAGARIDAVQIHLVARCRMRDMVKQDIAIQHPCLGQGEFPLDLRGDIPDLTDAQEISLHRDLSRVDDLAALAHKAVAPIRTADHGEVMGTGMDSCFGEAHLVVIIQFGSEHSHQVPMHRDQPVTAIVFQIGKAGAFAAGQRHLSLGKQHGVVLFPVTAGLLERDIGPVGKVPLGLPQEFCIGISGTSSPPIPGAGRARPNHLPPSGKGCIPPLPQVRFPVRS